MVTSEDSNSVLKAHLEGNEKRDSLNTVIAAIDVVTHEQIISVGWLATNLEKLAEIMELTVDIAANSHRCAHLLHV